MIHTEQEYAAAIERRDKQKMQLEAYIEQLHGQGLSAAMIEKAIQPYESFRLQLIEEIEEYEHMKRKGQQK